MILGLQPDEGAFVHPDPGATGLVVHRDGPRRRRKAGRVFGIDTALDGAATQPDNHGQRLAHVGVGRAGRGRRARPGDVLHDGVDHDGSP